MHAFGLKQALLAKHAQHVVIIHFPIALFVIGVVFDWIGQFRSNRELLKAAYYNFVVAAASVPLAVVSGIVAWQLQLHGERLKGILLLHLGLGSAAAALIVLVWWIHHRAVRRQIALPPYRVPLEAVGALLIALTGHLGGFLSGVNLPG